jgi:hypothetical protein
MQASRFELKYIIPEPVAQQVRDYVGSFLELDENGQGKPDLSYPVHSLYIDSDELQTYWDTINGNRDRFKLRIRYYDDDPSSPVFLEIKRRANSCIQKQRVGVVREAVRMVLEGQIPPPSLVLGKEPKHLMALQDFCRIQQQMGARPKVHVAYMREAYLPVSGNSTRLTMDRKVRSEPDPEARLSVTMTAPVNIWENTVVLELKFTDRYPDWFGDLVRTFNLHQCGAAKYADGIALLSGQMPQHRRMPQLVSDVPWAEVCGVHRPLGTAGRLARNIATAWNNLSPTDKICPEGEKQL